MSSIIEQIDNNLEKYYKVHGVNNYRNDQEQGKFQIWAEDNGMESVAIIEEIETADPTDSILTDIDDEFPLETYKDREYQIFIVLKKCIHEKNAFYNYKVKVPDLNDSFFNIDEKQVQETKKLYTNQCAAIMNSDMLKATGLFNLLTIGRSNGFKSYMLHLMDTFSRDRLSYHYQYKGSNEWVPALDQHVWAHPKNSPIFRNIKDENQRAQHMDAIRSYYSRLVSKLMFTNHTKIQDSVAVTARYITNAALFVEKLSKARNMFPFHIDITIGYKQARILEQQAMLPDYDDDEDEDYDGHYRPLQSPRWFDCIGNVKNKLCSNNFVYVEMEVNEKQNTDQYALGASGGAFKIVFEHFKQKLKIKGFPHGRRFCCFIDRRGYNPNKTNILMYEPPDNCKYIPNDNVSLWYLAASRSSVIPNEAYDGDFADVVNAVASNVCAILMDRDRKKGFACWIKETDYTCTLAKCLNKRKHERGMEFDLIIKVKRKYYKITVVRVNEPSMKYFLKDNMVKLVDFNPIEERIELGQMDLFTKEKLLMQNIKSNDHCKGAMLTISFHAIQKDEIKCYLCHNGQMMRFFPETDIKDLLPIFFDGNYDKENATWSQGDDVKRLIDQLSGTIRDHEFEAFYQKYKSSFIEKKRKDEFLAENKF